jgi:hypothetical protein
MGTRYGTMGVRAKTFSASWPKGSESPDTQHRGAYVPPDVMSVAWSAPQVHNLRFRRGHDAVDTVLFRLQNLRWGGLAATPAHMN